MFTAIPSGVLPRPDTGENWYIKISYDRYNELFFKFQYRAIGDLHTVSQYTEKLVIPVI